jgi:hypothetical protein
VLMGSVSRVRHVIVTFGSFMFWLEAQATCKHYSERVFGYHPKVFGWIRGNKGAIGCNTRAHIIPVVRGVLVRGIHADLSSKRPRLHVKTLR